MQTFWFIVTFTLVTLTCAKNYRGGSNYQQFQVNYDVELIDDGPDGPIYQIGNNDLILISNEQHLVFESKQELNLGQLIVTNNPINEQFIGRITSINNTQEDHVYIADHSHETLIKEGKIQIAPSNAKVPFCFGFNTESSCQHPKENINLFNNEILRADCDDCFAAIGGGLFLNLEFSNFRLKSVSFGLQQLHLRGGLGVTIDGQDHWSYVYDKTFAIINKQKIISFNVGPITLALYLDLPVEVNFRSDASVHGQIKYGIDVDLNLGNLYLEYIKGKWQTVKSTPMTTTQPYFSALSTVDGHAHFAILPMVSLYSPGLFHFNLHFNPESDLSLSGSTIRKEVCINSQYHANIIFNGDILQEKIKDITVYDSEIRQIIQKCFPIPSLI